MAYPTSAPRSDEIIDASSLSPGPTRIDAPETRRVQDMRAMQLRLRFARPSESLALDHEADSWSETPRGQAAECSGEEAEVSQSRVPSVKSLSEHGPRDMIHSPAPDNDFEAHNQLRPTLRVSPKAMAGETVRGPAAASTLPLECPVGRTIGVLQHRGARGELA